MRLFLNLVIIKTQESGCGGETMKRFGILVMVVLGLAALTCDLSSAVLTMTPDISPTLADAAYDLADGSLRG
jgi:hypothetical protein